MGRSIPEATIAVGRIRSMPFGRPRAEAAAREVRTIEADGPPEVKAYALESLVEALTWSGQQDRVMVPFVKLLRWWDEHPDMFDASDQNIMFWEFGWVMAALSQSASVPVDRVERVLDDMQRRFALASRGMERVWSSRMEWALISGSPRVDQVFTTWLTQPLDEEDSCPACHPEHRADYLVDQGRWTEAIGVLEDGLAAELTCSREPASMLALLACCYVNTGQLDQAEVTSTRALSDLAQATSPSLVLPHARLFEVFGRAGQPDMALPHLAALVTDQKIMSEYARLDALRHYLAGMTVLVRQGFGQELIGQPGLPATLAALADDFGRQAEELTAAFDQRHGNQVQAARLAAARSAEPTSRPLRPAASRTPAVVHPPAPPVEVAPDAVVLLRQQAETELANGLAEQAVATYANAAQVAEDQGRLAQAGWCWAEAARLIQDAATLGSPDQAYDAALSRLSAAGATLEEATPILVSWAPAVTAASFASFLRYAETRYPSPAQPQCGEDVEALIMRLVTPAMIGAPLIRRYVLAWAELKDATARAMATWGDGDQAEQALRYAEQAGSRFAMLGRTTEAAHAWWLAGRLAKHSASGDPDSNYRLAIDGFAATGERNIAFQHEAAGEYQAFLLDHQRPDEAADMSAWTKDGI